MDISSVIGLLLGFGGIIAGYLLEGGAMKALFLLPPACIVFGGTSGAVVLSFPLDLLKKLPKVVSKVFKTRKSSELELVELFVKLAETARRDGLLSLESAIEGEAGERFDPMLKEGIKMVVDGTDPELVKNMFETEIYIKDHVNKEEYEVFEAAGGFAPTLGIIGTVMGLIKVLGNLSSPEELSKSIASAFLATLYGLASANLVFLPMASKLKGKSKQDKLEKELIMEGVLSVQAGENPSIIRRKLNTFIVESKEKGKTETAEEEE